VTCVDSPGAAAVGGLFHTIRGSPLFWCRLLVGGSWSASVPIPNHQRSLASSNDQKSLPETTIVEPCGLSHFSSPFRLGKLRPSPATSTVKAPTCAELVSSSRALSNQVQAPNQAKALLPKAILCRALLPLMGSAPENTFLYPAALALACTPTGA
jgi:hypothetical protein